MIEEDDLETMIGFFRTACVKNGLKKAVVVNFLEFLSAKKGSLCRLKNSMLSAIPENQLNDDS